MPAHVVKGIIGANDLPPEARVSRLDECRLKQKVGYGQHVNPTCYFHFAGRKAEVGGWGWVVLGLSGVVWVGLGCLADFFLG